DFGDGAVAGQVLDVVSFALGQLRVAHGNLSCRKGRMLPHTGLFLLGKVALQMRIRRALKFDQLILEFPERGDGAWVHIGFRRNSPQRNQILTATKKNGKTVYLPGLHP
ncbi:TPA: hypothetical protein ACJMDA_002113, partial [Neisseria meningitidis]